MGSILHQSQAGDVVWGSGINGKVASRHYDFRGVDVRAVRGPMTRELINRHGGRCPEVYGDPGLLVATLYPDLGAPSPDSQGQGGVCVIPNLNDNALYGERLVDGHAATRYVSPLQDWRQVVREIRAASLVVASSLHGIILSDAYGVPCRPMLSLFEAPFKFEDYFHATGRTQVGYARSLNEALDMGPLPPARLDLQPLIDAFPADLFQVGG